MKFAKSLLKAGAVNYAARFGAHRRAHQQARLWVLMYHRILPKHDPRFHTEEPGMLVTPETFEMHLRELPKYFEVMSLSHWLALSHSGEALPAKACAITFDDGWLDNYEYALPLLTQYRTPATLFAVSDKLGTDFQFWPNCVLSLLFAGKYSLLATHPIAAALLPSLTAPQPMHGEFAAEVVRRFKSIPDSQIWQLLNELDWRNQLDQPLKPALMNWQQLEAMQASGWVEIGCHTANHKRLGSNLTDAELKYEILASKATLASHLNKPVNLFCFPNGDYNQETLALVKTNYAGAVTTHRGINTATANPHELLRIGIHEQVCYNPKLFSARLSGMM